ncbi:ABC transporter substrate-binding protein [Lamprobacter modestohalophilus]|uniref:MlaC/ttg2D family ABC transporter substrate-binding protein n=1 Tax=Lamprobacter modestohalophilus TaxID=1064514 RepID=UPI002ADEE04A|nr:ABC transporter substrate-binding protein [Lamprobacter modestohalophilus]MEA1050203.1 ABC transporter substrate-binding protein [Lamprobacter modestohalophilus]
MSALRIRTRRIRTLLVAGILLLAWPLASLGAEPSATQLVERTADKMLSTLENRRAEVERKPQLINELVDSILAPHFDFEQMTRLAVGRDWRTASPTQQQELTDSFRDLLVRTYAKSIMKYSGEDIVYEAARPGTRSKTVVVPTEVRAPGSAPIPIDYYMLERGSSWMVYDVVIDGVSMISNYRSQFRTTIATSGINGLIEQLRAKTARGA